MMIIEKIFAVILLLVVAGFFVTIVRNLFKILKLRLKENFGAIHKIVNGLINVVHEGQGIFR